MKKEDYQKLERIYKKFVLYANHFCLEDTILKSEINLFNKYIPNNIKSVVDVGCGYGRLFNYFLKRFSKINIIGFERDKKTFDKLKSIFIMNNIKIFNKSFIEKSNVISFDVCLCLGNTYGAFLRKNDRIKFLKLVLSKLDKNNGLFILDYRTLKDALITENVIDVFYQDDGGIILFEEDINGKKLLGVQYYPNQNKLKEQLKSIGYSVCNIIKVNDSRFPRNIIILKPKDKNEKN